MVAGSIYMNLPQIYLSTERVSQVRHAPPADILSSREAGIFSRAFLMMESTLSPLSTAYQHGEIQRIKAALRALSAELDLRLA